VAAFFLSLNAKAGSREKLSERCLIAFHVHVKKVTPV
jgi:hypothetical protein